MICNAMIVEYTSTNSGYSVTPNSLLLYKVWIIFFLCLNIRLFYSYKHTYEWEREREKEKQRDTPLLSYKYFKLLNPNLKRKNFRFSSLFLFQFILIYLRITINLLSLCLQDLNITESDTSMIADEKRHNCTCILSVIFCWKSTWSEPIILQFVNMPVLFTRVIVLFFFHSEM